MSVKNLRMVRAVHRLKRVLFALARGNPEELVGEFVPMPTLFVQVFFGDMGDSDALVAVLGAQLPDKLIELLAQGGALGCPQRQPRADQLGEGKEVKLLADDSVVALFNLYSYPNPKIKNLHQGGAGDFCLLLIGGVCRQRPVGQPFDHYCTEVDAVWLVGEARVPFAVAEPFAPAENGR